MTIYSEREFAYKPSTTVGAGAIQNPTTAPAAPAASAVSGSSGGSGGSGGSVRRGMLDFSPVLGQLSMAGAPAGLFNDVNNPINPHFESSTSGGDEYGHTVNDGYAQLPFTLVDGGRLGLDNNYAYAIYPDGRVEQAFRAQGADAMPVDKTLEDLIGMGFDPTTASTDAHGQYLPGNVGGLDFSPTAQYRSEDKFLDQLLFGVAPGMIYGALAAPIAGAGVSGALQTTGAAGAIPGGMLPTVQKIGTGLAVSGGNPVAAAKGLALGAGAEGIASGVNAGIDALNAPNVPAAPQPSMPAATPEVDPTFGGNLSENLPGMFAASAAAGGSGAMMPATSAEGDPTFGGALTQTGAGQFENLGNIASFGGMLSPTAPSHTQAALNSLDQQDKEALTKQQHVTGEQVQKIANLATTLAKMNGGSDTPDGAPRQQEGQSNEQYLQQLVQYANVDAQTMSDLGLKPGSPEYYKYVMDQMDSIIAQLTDGMDLNAPNLTDQLHTKTDQEMQALQRALFVRGQIDKLVGSGSYTDPFTGRSEDVIAPNGGMFQPDVAAYQRGLARSADTLAGMQGTGGAQEFLDSLLHRSPDLYGMQKGADTRYEQARQSEEDLRRRGMLGQLSEAELQQLLQSTGL